MENVIPKDQIEQYVVQLFKDQWQQAFTNELLEPRFLALVLSHFPKLMEEYVKANELKAKEMAIMERVTRVEEELKSLRLMSEQNFDIMKQRFEMADKRFDSMQHEMNTRFDVVDKRFDVADQRFESLLHEMNARFDVVDKKFSFFQWILGIVLGIPALIFTFTQLYLAFK